MSREMSTILKDIGCDKYCRQFVEEEIDYEAFLELDEERLLALKLPMGPRMKILKKVKRLNTEKEDSGKAIFFV